MCWVFDGEEWLFWVVFVVLDECEDWVVWVDEMLFLELGFDVFWWCYEMFVGYCEVCD